MSHSLDLSGTWTFALDPEDIGIQQKWFEQSHSLTVHLPGSLDENGIGTLNQVTDDLSGLSRKFHYTGPAWYSKTVEIPAELRGKPFELNLERVHWFSSVWVNGGGIGQGDSLSVPHVYEIPASLPSESIRIDLRIDNTPHIPVGRIGHALTDWTQTNWNGVIGKMTLTEVESAVQNYRITTSGRRLFVTADALAEGDMKISIPQLADLPLMEISVRRGQHIEVQIPVASAVLWSESSPMLYDVILELNGTRCSQRTGFTTIDCEGSKILFNDQPIFLRGTLECCVFPKTGYPPTTKQEWAQIMRKAQSFGLNHLRFHSWCPPEAAFVAADEAGVILQAELPVWTGLWPISSDASLLDFCRREAHRILSAYGHHPSFAMFALGNEIAFYGEEPEVDALVKELKETYPNRIYTFSAQGTHLSSECNFYVQADNGKPGPENKPLRGSTWFGVGSRFDREMPNTLVTCDEAASQFDRPVISHEVAEWAVFPDVYNAQRYDGNLEARNFNTIARMLEERGMLDQAPQFVAASGKLSTQLYKEEIETLLRTDGLAGYQLLGLTDFPGQGTATIGMLDAFWDEKGFVTAEEFSEFCAPTVPLLRFAKQVWLDDELFEARADVFHAGESKNLELQWRLMDGRGQLVDSGVVGKHPLQPGTAVKFGTVCFPLDKLPSPAKYQIELVTDSGERNHWDLWVMPKWLEPVDNTDLHISQFYGQDVRKALSDGKSVWLRINPKRIWSGIPGRFAPAFWSPIHFKEQVGTMGTLIDDQHPLFAEFPTEFHSNWHWWDILTNSKAMNLNSLPLDFRPMLQVIDRYERNDKLGTIFEAQVGTGKLLVTMIDFDSLDNRPASRQLEHSIRKYLASPEFQPTQTLTLDHLDQAFIREP